MDNPKRRCGGWVERDCHEWHDWDDSSPSRKPVVDRVVARDPSNSATTHVVICGSPARDRTHSHRLNAGIGPSSWVAERLQFVASRRVDARMQHIAGARAGRFWKSPMPLMSGSRSFSVANTSKTWPTLRQARHLGVTIAPVARPTLSLPSD